MNSHNTPQPGWGDPPAIERSRAERLEDLRQKTINYELQRTEKSMRAERTRIHIGERGGRYYKRTRADGTTYRDYTW